MAKSLFFGYSGVLPFTTKRDGTMPSLFVPDARQYYFFFFTGAFFAVAFFAVPQPPPFALQAMITSFSERYSFKLSQQQLSVNK